MQEVNLLTTLPFDITDILMILKLVYLLGMLIYLVFAAVIVKQVGMMQASLKGELRLPLGAIAYSHLLATVIVFFIAVFIALKL